MAIVFAQKENNRPSCESNHNTDVIFVKRAVFNSLFCT